MPQHDLFPGLQGNNLHPALHDPWDAAASWEENVAIAVLVKVDGPAYRSVGSAMAISAEGRIAGSITSGCIDADIVLHAQEVLASGQGRTLRYGKGSTFMDLTLPCGGAVELRVFKLRDSAVLAELGHLRRAREHVLLLLDQADRLHLGEALPGVLSIAFAPSMAFALFGTGAEPVVFAHLLNSFGYRHVLYSHDRGTVAAASRQGIRTVELRNLAEVELIDAQTAVALFYHDHDYELPILQAALRTPAFYIGAQGSRATHAARCARLQEGGASMDQIARVYGPMGLISASRDPKALAMSVMAEIMAAFAQAAPAQCPSKFDGWSKSASRSAGT